MGEALVHGDTAKAWLLVSLISLSWFAGCCFHLSLRPDVHAEPGEGQGAATSSPRRTIMLLTVVFGVWAGCLWLWQPLGTLLAFGLAIASMTARFEEGVASVQRKAEAMLRRLLRCSGAAASPPER